MTDRKVAHVEKQICARLRTMKNFIISKTDSIPVAEDIYGEAVLKIWQIIRSGKFKEGHSIDSFMCWCSRSAISNYFRKEKNYSSFVQNKYPSYCNTSTKSPEREYEIAMENRLFIEKMIQALGVLYRKVIILLLFQNMKLYEIAETLEMPWSTVGNCLHRMRKQFGVYLGRARVQKTI